MSVDEIYPEDSLCQRLGIDAATFMSEMWKASLVCLQERLGACWQGALLDPPACCAGGSTVGNDAPVASTHHPFSEHSVVCSVSSTSSPHPTLTDPCTEHLTRMISDTRLSCRRSREKHAPASGCACHALPSRILCVHRRSPTSHLSTHSSVVEKTLL